MLRRLKNLAQCFLFRLTSPQMALLFGEPFFWLLGLRRRGGEVDLCQIKRVLVVRLDEIGDVVMSTPFLRELRRNLPDAWITLVVKPAVYNLVELSPYVSEVLTYDWRANGRFADLRLHGRALWLALHYLWRRRFDLAIIPRWDVDYYHATFLAYFSGALGRVGYSEDVVPHKKALNSSIDRLFTHLISDGTPKHEVEHNLDVIRFLGGQVQERQLEIWFSNDDEIFAGQVLKYHGVHADDTIIVFCLGAGALKRMWPLPNFVELGAWLKRKYHARILIVGGLQEKSLGQQLEEQLGKTVINVAGKATLRQTGAFLQRCHLYVGNDAGPMHLAVAAGVPVIEISCHPLDGSPWHPNSPKRFGPWGVPHRVVQTVKALVPCSEGCIADRAHCILGISVEQVKQAISSLLLF